MRSSGRTPARGLGWQPLQIGRVERGAGVFVGALAIDGARLRNLAAAARDDLQGYLSALSAL